MGENLHEGHRKRLKQEFTDNGFNDSTPAHKWLELLLFYCIPQKDTNELAHKLLDKFGSLCGVFEAPISELVKFPGITENNVVLLKMIIPLARRCSFEKSKDLYKISTPENIGHYILTRYYGLDKEKLSVVCLNQVGKIIDFKFISDGDMANVSISSRDILKLVLEKNSYCVIIAHNHPNGYALPSKEDIDATVKLRDLLETVNVRLLDHIIISGNDYVSLAQSKEYCHIFN